MAYTVTNFSAYVAKHNELLTATLFAGGDTAKFARFIENVKGSILVPHLEESASLQTGACASASGAAVLSEVTLTVTPFTSYKTYCQDTLENLLPYSMVAPGSNNGDTLPWEAELIETRIKRINQELEMTYWQGTTGGTYTTFVGWINKLDANASVVSGNTGAITAMTTSNIKDAVDAMRTANSALVTRSSEYVTMVGDDYFDLYIAAEKADNLYHYKPEHDDGVYEIGGGRGKLIRCLGLDGTNRMFASVGSNFIVGSDIDNESEVAEVWYDQTTDLMNVRVKGKAGVTFANAGEIVDFTLAS
jgi:hypothetical protein